jgi:hypothetical protein
MSKYTIKLDVLEIEESQLDWAASFPNLPIQITNFQLPPYPSKYYGLTPMEEKDPLLEGEVSPPEDPSAPKETDIPVFDRVGKYVNTPRNITMFVNLTVDALIALLDLFPQQISVNNLYDEQIFDNPNWQGFVFTAPRFHINTKVWIGNVIMNGFYFAPREDTTTPNTKMEVKVQIDLVESFNPEVLFVERPRGLPPLPTPP